MPTRAAVLLLSLSLGTANSQARAEQDARLDLGIEAVDAWVAAAEAAAPRPSAQPLTIEDVTVVDLVQGRHLPHRRVVIAEGRIHTIGAAAGPRPMGGAVLEGRDLYLVPGLVDAHVHLADFMLDVLPLFVAEGVTTIVNLSGSPGALRLADRLSTSTARAPRLVAAGPFVQRRSGLDGSAACDHTRGQVEAGYAALKFYQEDMAEEDFRRFLACVRELPVPVFGHLVDGSDLEWLLDSRFVIAHAEELIGTRWRGRDDWLREPGARTDAARALADSGVSLVANLALYAGFIDMLDDDAYAAMLAAPEMELMPPVIRQLYGPDNPYRQHGHAGSGGDTQAERMRARLAELQAFTAAFDAAGGTVLAGSDAPNPMAIYGVSLQRELAALGDAGLPALSLLRAATVNPHSILAGKAVDPLAPGAPADLLLLDSDPLADPAAVAQPRLVILRGQPVDPTALREGMCADLDRRC